jgi:hypothetical protein
VKKKLAIIIGIIMTALVISMKLHSLTNRVDARTADAAAAASGLVDAIAGEGTVEPISEDIKLGSDLSGKLKSVSVSQETKDLFGNLAKSFAASGKKLHRLAGT